MPGMGRGPTRSRRLWSLSKDRCECQRRGSRRCAVWRPVLSLWMPLPGRDCMGFFPATVSRTMELRRWDCLPIGDRRGHLAVGTLLLWRNRVTLDRSTDTLSVRRGWLGVVRHSFSLAQFRSISIRPALGRWSCLVQARAHEIILAGDMCPSVVIGFAASDELAAEIEHEVRRFLWPS